MTRRILGAFAHPDDDMYGVGGSLALHAGREVEITMVIATSGDAGRIADPWLATPETLGTVREAEELAAWAALGLDADVRFLRHPDGRLAQVPREQLVAELLSLMELTRPQVVVTFGPDGVTGHEDHIAVGAAATEAFHAARTAASDGAFARLLYQALPLGRIERLNELLRERGLEPIDQEQPFSPRGVPDHAIGVAVDCARVYERKLAALREHRTQAELEDVPFDLWPQILGVESFAIAWPEIGISESPMTDLFAALPSA